MTIYYVDVSAAGGGSGTEGDPYNDPSTAYTASLNGDTIKIRTSGKGGGNEWTPTAQIQDVKGINFEPWDNSKVVVNASSNVSSYILRLEHADSTCHDFQMHSVATGKYGFRIIKDLTLFDDNIIEDSTGTACLIGAGLVGTTHWYRNIWRRCNTGWNINGLGAAAVMNLYACESYNHVLYDRIDSANNATSQFNFHNCLSGGNESYMYWIRSGNVDIYNPIMIQGATDNSTETILNVGAGAVVIHNGVGTKAIFDPNTPSVKGFTNSGAGSITVDSSMKGETLPVGKLFKTPRRQGSVCFKRDDYEEYVTGGTYAGEGDSWFAALDARNIKGSASINSRQADNPSAISATGWAELKAYADAGHDLGTEGTTGVSLNNTDQFDITYTGAAVVCRLVISGNNLTTYEDGVEDLNIDFPASSYTVTSLIAAINGDASYTCTVSDADTGGSNPSILADIDIADISTLYTVAVDEDRFFAYELATNKQDIIANTGYTPAAHTYSTGGYNANAAAYMAANGWIGGRLGTVANPAKDAIPKPFTDDIDRFASFGLHVSNQLDMTSDATIRRGVDAWCQWAMWHGAAITIYDHEYATTTLAQWEVIFDACIASGITVHGTMKAQYEWLQTVTVPTTDTDDSWIPELDSDGDNHGTGTRSWTGANPVGASGEPFSDFDTDIGSVQSTNSPFHPKNL